MNEYVCSDKSSGRVYYYNSVTRSHISFSAIPFFRFFFFLLLLLLKAKFTKHSFCFFNNRETTWTKPLELSDPQERKEREQAQANLLDFFRDMENNMRNKIKMGLNSSDVMNPKPANVNGAAEPDAGPRNFSTDLLEFPGRTVRTISTVDDLVLEQAKRSDSYGSSPQSAARRKDSANFFESEEISYVGSPIAAEFDKMSRRNSCSTVFVDSTMSMPDKEATIKCVCTVIRAHMLEAIAANDGDSIDKEHPKAKVFHDYEFLKAGASYKARVPPLNELILFFRDLYTKSQMETECIIMSLIYMERLTRETKGRVQVLPHNWKSLMVSAMIMSSKVWDDLSMWNADFSQVCPSFTLQRINELELVSIPTNTCTHIYIHTFLCYHYIQITNQYYHIE
jgi:hypothetical protein